MKTGLTIQPLKTKKVVRLLKDPHPKFLSLVTNAATQTPFQVLKNFIKVSEDLDMKNENVKLISIRFSKENFPDEEAVLKFVEEKRFSDFDEITETDDSFLIGYEPSDDEVKRKFWTPFGDEPGVEALTVEFKSEESEEQKSEEPAQEEKKEEKKPRVVKARRNKTKQEVQEENPEPEVAEPEETKAKEVETEPQDEEKKKHDWYGSFFSGSTDFGGVLKAGEDGIPIGLRDVTDIMIVAMSNAFTIGKSEDVEGIAQDYAKSVVYLKGLYDLFPKSEDEDTEEKSVKPAEKVQKSDKPEEPEKKDEDPVLSELKKMNKSLEENQKTIKGLQDRIDELESTATRYSDEETEEEKAKTAEELQAEQEKLERKKAFYDRLNRDRMGLPRS